MLLSMAQNQVANYGLSFILSQNLIILLEGRSYQKQSMIFLIKCCFIVLMFLSKYYSSFTNYYLYKQYFIVHSLLNTYSYYSQSYTFSLYYMHYWLYQTTPIRLNSRALFYKQYASLQQTSISLLSRRQNMSAISLHTYDIVPLKFTQDKQPIFYFIIYDSPQSINTTFLAFLLYIIFYGLISKCTILNLWSKCKSLFKDRVICLLNSRLSTHYSIENSMQSVEMMRSKPYLLIRWGPMLSILAILVMKYYFNTIFLHLLLDLYRLYRVHFVTIPLKQQMELNELFLDGKLWIQLYLSVLRIFTFMIKQPQHNRSVTIFEFRVYLMIYIFIFSINWPYMLQMTPCFSKIFQIQQFLDLREEPIIQQQLSN